MVTPGNFQQFLPHLIDGGVRFILIGGGAGIAHGLARATYDVDIVYDRRPDNLQALVNSLQGLNLYYRGAPPGLPFKFDVRMLENGLNFTFTSDWGDIDLLAEVPGDGTYDSLLRDADTFNIFDRSIKVVNLKRLIQLKQAAGRPKDFETVAELQALLEDQS